MKTLIVMPFFYPATRFGGPVLQAFEVAKRLASRGHSVSVVTSDLGLDASARRNQWVSREGINIYYGTTNWYSKYPPYFMPSLNKVLQKSIAECDVVYVRVGLTMLNSAVVRTARTCSTPVVYNAEGCLCPTRLKAKRVSKWFFLRLFERQILMACTRLNACSAKESEDYVLQGADRQKIDIIPNGVDLPTQGAISDALAERFRQQFSIPSGPIVLYMGRLVAMKRPDLLLDAFSQVDPKYKAQLVFAGADWGMESALRKRAEASSIGNQVQFVGELGGDAKAGALSAASIFALISESEGLPNAVLEALAHGIPCVVSRFCNVDQISGANAGFITELDATEVARQLTALLSDEQLRRSQSAAAKRLASECFSIDSVVLSIEASLMQASRVRSAGA
jgi:glycosyltransferase involved in cell wall biosynthesis